jgi:NAD(P)-dependent dehydrogenase (short-subunit alcohol dehydrogenase family)
MSIQEEQKLIDMFNMKDKVIIITGSSSGIGLACAKDFLKLGAKVCINSRKSDRLEHALNSLEKYKEQLMGVAADGRIEEQASTLINKVVDTFGRVDVLINNAGGSFPIDTENLSSNGFNSVVETNLNTVFHFSKGVLPIFKTQGFGKIINISSVAGIHPTPTEAHYGSSKAAVNHLTTTLAHEWGRLNIQVNAIAPGPIMTKLAKEHLWNNEEKKKKVESQIALGRIGSTEDVFNACLYLASEAADYVTGVVLKVDGGTKSIMG